MRRLLRDLDIDFYNFIFLKIFLAEIMEIMAVKVNVRYCPKSPSLYMPFFRKGRSIKEAIDPQIITQTEIYKIILNVLFFSINQLIPNIAEVTGRP